MLYNTGEIINVVSQSAL